MEWQPRISPGDFYIQTVLLVLVEQLDRAFPEFGWRRDARGWVATNQETTHQLLGVRADRVVPHGHAPQGFLVLGAEPVLWTTHQNGGAVPHGQDFIRIIRELARRAGIDPTPLDRLALRDRRSELLNHFFFLRGQRTRVCRRDSRARVLRAARTPRRHDRLLRPRRRPPPAHSRHALHEAEYSDVEITESNVLADSR